MARAQQVPGSTPVRDVLQGLMALADEPIAGGRHKVFGHPRPGRHPADVDDRLAPAARGRAGRRAAPRPPAGSRPASGRAMPSWSARSVTRRPITRPRSARSTPRQHQLPRPAGTDPVRLRGQRAGASRCRRRRAGSSPRTGRAPVCDYLFGRRRRSRRSPSGDHGGRPPGPRAPPPGLPAPADGPVPRPRRQRRRDQLPHAARDRGRLRPGSAPGNGRALVGPAVRDPEEVLRPVRPDPCGDRRRGRRAAGSAASRLGARR